MKMYLLNFCWLVTLLPLASYSFLRQSFCFFFRFLLSSFSFLFSFSFFYSLQIQLTISFILFQTVSLNGINNGWMAKRWLWTRKTKNCIDFPKCSNDIDSRWKEKVELSTVAHGRIIIEKLKVNIVRSSEEEKNETNGLFVSLLRFLFSSVCSAIRIVGFVWAIMHHDYRISGMKITILDATRGNGINIVIDIKTIWFHFFFFSFYF